jgi:flagellar hook-basal body complex protein FliE
MSGAAAQPAQQIGPGFGDILNSAVGSISQAGATAEGAITNAALGRGDLVDVETAVAAAEATLETVIAVRDEVIKAYQDIMRMAI